MTHRTSWARVHETPPTCTKCGAPMFSGIVASDACADCRPAKQAQHTQGEWLTEVSDSGAIIWVGCPRYTIATVSATADRVNLGEMRANANLMAASPKLLEALIRVMEIDIPITGNPTHAELVEHWEYEKSQGRGEAEDRLFALAAIAQATGATP